MDYETEIKRNEEIIRKHYERILSSPKEIEEKLTICGSCEYLDQNRVCTACGCGVDIKVKKRTASCPIGKWVATISLDE